eukprot:PhF_6_TR8664/c0_g1_i1/m.13550
MADFGVQFIAMRNTLPAIKSQHNSPQSSKASSNPALKYQITKEEQEILDRLNGVSYSPYMLYIPAPTTDTLYAKKVMPTQDDPSPALQRSKEATQDTQARKMHRTRLRSFAQSGETALKSGGTTSSTAEVSNNLKLIQACFVTNCLGARTQERGQEKIVKKQDFFMAIKTMGITNEVFMETLYMHLDDEDSGYIPYQPLLKEINNHVNGPASSGTIRACFEVFKTNKRDSILFREIRALKGARAAEAHKHTNGGTFPMLKILFDVWNTRDGKDPLLMDYDEFVVWMKSDPRFPLAFVEEIFRQILVQKYKCRRDDLLASSY